MCATVHTHVYACVENMDTCLCNGVLEGTPQLFGGPLVALFFSSALTSSVLTKIREFALVKICLRVYPYMVSILEKSRTEGGPGQFCHASRKISAYDTFKTWSFSHYQHHPKLRDPDRCLSRMTGARQSDRKKWASGKLEMKPVRSGRAS